MTVLTRRARVAAAIAMAIAGAAATAVFAQSSAVDEIAKYRAALQDGNPAELWEARGEDLWKTPRGPKKVSFATCDLGLGPGVVKGAYAQLPKYFADADRVMDLETRLVHCMVTQQGYTDRRRDEGPLRRAPGKKSDIEALVAYVTSQSRGVKMNVALGHPKEKEAFALGEKMFVFRGGTHDFSCATCHGEDGKRIRLQDLPNLMTVAGAQKAYTTWPAYRVSQGELRIVPVAALRLLPAAALPGTRVHVGRVDRADDVSRPQCQRRRVRRARHQTLTGERDAQADLDVGVRWPALASAVVGCATAPSDVEVSRQAAAVLKGSFKANGQAGMDRWTRTRRSACARSMRTSRCPRTSRR